MDEEFYQRWIDETSSTIKDEMIHVKMPGLDSFDVPVVHTDIKSILYDFAIAFVNQIHAENYLYQLFFQGGLSADIRSVRVHILKFLQEKIDLYIINKGVSSDVFQYAFFDNIDKEITAGHANPEKHIEDVITQYMSEGAQ